MQNQIISELYTDHKRSKYSSNPNDIFKSAKKLYVKIYTEEATSRTATTELLSKSPNRKKISDEQFHLCKANLSLDEVTKSINSQTIDKSTGNDGLTAEFY